jgi:hypothetical protein
VTALDKAWSDSLTTPQEQEQGGNVVRTYGGEYKLRRGTDHTGNMFEPDPNDVGRTETLVGIAHTHPYRDEGQDHGTFSGQDLGNMVQEDQPLKVLRSGPFTYMIARTREFDAIVARYDKANTSFELQKQINATFDKAFDAKAGDFPEKLEAGVLAVCAEYHLVYYEGQGANLRRVSGGHSK